MPQFIQNSKVSLHCAILSVILLKYNLKLKSADLLVTYWPIFTKKDILKFYVWHDICLTHSFVHERIATSQCIVLQKDQFTMQSLRTIFEKYIY